MRGSGRGGILEATLCIVLLAGAVPGLAARRIKNGPLQKANSAAGAEGNAAEPVANSAASAVEVAAPGTVAAFSLAGAGDASSSSSEVHQATRHLSQLDAVEATRQLVKRFGLGTNDQCLQVSLGDRVGCVADCQCGFGRRCYHRYALIGGEGGAVGNAARFNLGVCDVDMRVPLAWGLFFFIVLFLGSLVLVRLKSPLLKHQNFTNAMDWQVIQEIAGGGPVCSLPTGHATLPGIGADGSGGFGDPSSSPFSYPEPMSDHQPSLPE